MDDMISRDDVIQLLIKVKDKTAQLLKRKPIDAHGFVLLMNGLIERIKIMPAAKEGE